MKNLLYWLLMPLALLYQCTQKADSKIELLSSEYNDDGLISTTKCNFTMYSDSTWMFTINEYQEFRHEKNEIFRGRYLLHGDSIIFFPFEIEQLNSDKAIIKNGYIEFLDGDVPLKMKVLQTKLKNNQYVDSLKYRNYSFFTYDSSFYYNFSGEVMPYDLKNKDIILIDSILTSCIKENSEYITYEFDDYFKQCVSVINAQNEREVWVNLLCKGDNYRHLNFYVAYVNDGGDCFFNLKINLDKRTYYDLYINGGA